MWCSVTGTRAQISHAISCLLNEECRRLHPPITSAGFIKSEAAAGGSTTTAAHAAPSHDALVAALVVPRIEVLHPDWTPASASASSASAATSSAAGYAAAAAAEEGEEIKREEMGEEADIAPASPLSLSDSSAPVPSRPKHTRSSGTLALTDVQPPLVKGDVVRVKWRHRKTPIGVCRGQCTESLPGVEGEACCRWYVGTVRDVRRELVSDKKQPTFQVEITYKDKQHCAHNLMQIMYERFEAGGIAQEGPQGEGGVDNDDDREGEEEAEEGWRRGVLFMRPRRWRHYWWGSSGGGRWLLHHVEAWRPATRTFRGGLT